MIDQWFSYPDIMWSDNRISNTGKYDICILIFLKFHINFANITDQKELNDCLKVISSYLYTFATWWCKHMILPTLIIWSSRINSLNVTTFWPRSSSSFNFIKIMKKKWFGYLHITEKLKTSVFNNLQLNPKY